MASLIYIGVIAFLLGHVWWLSAKVDQAFWRGYVQGQHDHELGINMAEGKADGDG